MSYHEKRLFMHESTSFPGKLTLSNRRWKKNTKWHRLSAFKRHKSVLRFSLKNSNIQITKWHRRTHDILRCITSEHFCIWYVKWKEPFQRLLHVWVSALGYLALCNCCRTNAVLGDELLLIDLYLLRSVKYYSCDQFHYP